MGRQVVGSGGQLHTSTLAGGESAPPPLPGHVALNGGRYRGGSSLSGILGL